MLVIPLKCAPRYDLREPLAQWLDRDPTLTNPFELVHVSPDFKSCDCRDDIVRLASIRNCLSASISKPLSHKVALEEFALQDCHEYHAALIEFIKRGFPTCDELAPSIKLEWKGAFGQESETHGSFQWDRACTIWNIAALESYLASTQSPEKEGRKQAVKHCQVAATMMRHLHDEVVENHKFETVDLSKSCLKFWEHTMLANAQLATYEMATCGETLKGMLAMGAVPLFNEALQYSKDPLLVSHLVETKQWSVYCKAWSMWLNAKAAHHQARAEQEKCEWGIELAWLNETIQTASQVLDFCNTNYPPLYREIKDEMSTVKVRMAQASKDNNNIYAQEIPIGMPKVQPKQLVKSDGPLPESMLTPKKSLFKS